MSSPFPIKDAECEIRDSESDDDYSEGEDGARDDGAEDDNNMLNTQAIIQHLEDPPFFMCALNLKVIHAPEFPEYANMTSDCNTDCELCVGM